MSLLSEKVLQTLICSVCKKYLSVFPVKVFSNKNIKCGRCCEKDDGGTTSGLYELVAKQFQFPCINRFEGCKEVLLTSEIEKHELSCNPDEYLCSFCSFKSSSYDLLYHMQLNHKKMALKHYFFLIEKDQGSSRDAYFYCKNSIFVLVRYEYDAEIQQLSLSLEFICTQHRSRQNILHQFMLYSVGNKLQYKTGEMEIGEKSFKIDLSEHKYPKNIIVCKFNVWESAVMLNKYLSDQGHAIIQCDFPPVVDKSAYEALLKFKFEEVSKLEIDKDVDSVAKYWVGDILWKLTIEKTKEDNKCFLGVYLYQEGLPQSCNLTCIITLVSFTGAHHHKFLRINKKKFKDNLGCSKYLDWDEFINPLNGYIKNDFVHFYALITVLPLDEIKCNGCDDLMVCSKCDT